MRERREKEIGGGEGAVIILSRALTAGKVAATWSKSDIMTCLKMLRGVPTYLLSLLTRTKMDNNNHTTPSFANVPVCGHLLTFVHILPHDCPWHQP